MVGMVYPGDVTSTVHFASDIACSSSMTANNNCSVTITEDGIYTVTIEQKNTFRSNNHTKKVDSEYY